MPSAPRDRRSSSNSSTSRPSLNIPVRQPLPQNFTPTSSQPTYAPVYAQHAPVYARTVSHQSHHSTHTPHDPHAYADGEDKYDTGVYGVLDEETEREYERRYRKERAAERRPTLGGSVLSALSKVGGLLSGERR